MELAKHTIDAFRETCKSAHPFYLANPNPHLAHSEYCTIRL